MNQNQYKNDLSLKIQIKSMIQQMIDEGDLASAMTNLHEYEKILPDDADTFSLRALIALKEDDKELARDVLFQGLQSTPSDFDLTFNLAYLLELSHDYETALIKYMEAGSLARTPEQKADIEIGINRLRIHGIDADSNIKIKIAFLVKKGLDSFVDIIIDKLCPIYNVKKIIVDQEDQIDTAMAWADIIWFEWCDDLVIYGSRLQMAPEKKIVCRLHSYEAFTHFISEVRWENVDKVIFVARHIRDIVLSKISIDVNRTVIIPNGIDTQKLNFRHRKNGYNIAYLGYINSKKGPMLLLHALQRICKKDNRYKLYIAGKFQEERDILYFNQMVKEFGLVNNIIFEGWQSDVDKWMDDKDYIICTSILESQNTSVMQAMVKGIKPLIHNFVGARGVYPGKYLWNTIDECFEMLDSEEYDSSEYRNFVVDHYSIDIQISDIKRLIDEFGIPKTPTRYLNTLQ